MELDKNSEEYKAAKRKVDAMKGFYGHLISYIVVIAFFSVVNFLTSPNYPWVIWVILGWGIGIFWHGFGVFMMGNTWGKNWEEKKIREIMDK